MKSNVTGYVIDGDEVKELIGDIREKLRNGG